MQRLCLERHDEMERKSFRNLNLEWISEAHFSAVSS
jgi:hypothetical protein